MNSSTDDPMQDVPVWQAPTVEALAADFPALRLERLLAQGGMSAVYLARQETLDRRVVLKVLPPEIGEDLAAVERFSREAKVLAKLRDPAIVEIYDFGQSAGGYLYLVLEYEEAGDLRRWAQDRDVTLAEAIAIGEAAASALVAAHAEDVVHGDIKPDNIFLDAKGRIKVGDFGLADFAGAEASFHTPGYTAPEILAGLREGTPRSDLYALGATIFELLFRTPPPEERSELDRRLASLPPALGSCLGSLLAENPTDRPESARELQAEFQRVKLALKSGSVPRPAIPQPAISQPRPATKRSAPAAVPEAQQAGWAWGKLVAAFVGLAVIVGAGWMMHGQGKEDPDSADPPKSDMPPITAKQNPPTPPEEPKALPPNPTPEPPAVVAAPAQPEKSPAEVESRTGQAQAEQIFESWDEEAGRKPQGLDDAGLAAWNPDWKLTCPKNSQGGAAYLSTSEIDGQRPLVLHPFDYETPAKMERTVALAADEPMQLQMNVGAMPKSWADWELQAFANDFPLGAPEIISARNPESRFRIVTWDLSPWQGQTVKLRLECWPGGNTAWNLEFAYWVWIKLSPLAADAERDWPEEIRPMLGKLAKYRMDQREQWRKRVVSFRQSLAKTLQSSPNPIHVAEARRIGTLPPEESLMSSNAAAGRLVGTWRSQFLLGQNMELLANGTIASTNERWRWIDERSGLFVCYGNADVRRDFLGFLSGTTARCINADGESGIISRVNPAPAAGSEVLPEIHAGIRQEGNWEKEMADAIAAKCADVGKWLQPRIASLAEPVRMAILQKLVDESASGKRPPEDVAGYPWIWKAGDKTLEFRLGGVLAVDGVTSADSRWQWMNASSLYCMVFHYGPPGNETAGLARVARSKSRTLRVYTLKGASLSQNYTREAK